jgi:hypothetical protein
MCVSGARWVRENILETYPEEEIVVYAVWFNMIPTDRQDRWDPDLLSDKRVRHYWDENRVLGTWISDHVEECEHLSPVDWDSYYLFDSDGVWSDTFEPITACGSPIYKTTERLEAAVERLFKTSGE